MRVRRLSQDRTVKELALIGFIALVLGVAVWRLVGVFAPPGPAPDDGLCLLHERACSALLGDGLEVSLATLQRPIVAFETTTFVLTTAADASLEGATLLLEMPGMTMGVPPVALVRRSDGALLGEATVPMCPSGHTAWVATLEVPGRGTARFDLHVTPP